MNAIQSTRTIQPFWDLNICLYRQMLSYLYRIIIRFNAIDILSDVIWQMNDKFKMMTFGIS